MGGGGYILNEMALRTLYDTVRPDIMSQPLVSFIFYVADVISGMSGGMVNKHAWPSVGKSVSQKKNYLMKQFPC